MTKYNNNNYDELSNVQNKYSIYLELGILLQ